MLRLVVAHSEGVEGGGVLPIGFVVLAVILGDDEKVCGLLGGPRGEVDAEGGWESGEDAWFDVEVVERVVLVLGLEEALEALHDVYVAVVRRVMRLRSTGSTEEGRGKGLYLCLHSASSSEKVIRSHKRCDGVDCQFQLRRSRG